MSLLDKLEEKTKTLINAKDLENRGRALEMNKKLLEFFGRYRSLEMKL